MRLLGTPLDHVDNVTIIGDDAIAQRSHEYINVIDGDNQDLWSPISGFYQTQDNRWIQLHCNFPHAIVIKIRLKS